MLNLFRRYLALLRRMRDRRRAGRCIMCGRPATHRAFCEEHDLDQMAAP